MPGFTEQRGQTLCSAVLCCALLCCAVPPVPCRAPCAPRAPGPQPAPPLGLRRLHDVRPGGAQLPRPEGEVAPAALENGMHGGLLSAEQEAGGGGKRQEVAEKEAAEPLCSRLSPHGAHGPRNRPPAVFPLPGPRWNPGMQQEQRWQQGEGGDGARIWCVLSRSGQTWSSWSGASAGQRKCFSDWGISVRWKG